MNSTFLDVSYTVYVQHVVVCWCAVDVVAGLGLPHLGVPCKGDDLIVIVVVVVVCGLDVIEIVAVVVMCGLDIIEIVW